MSGTQRNSLTSKIIDHILGAYQWPFRIKELWGGHSPSLTLLYQIRHKKKIYCRWSLIKERNIIKRLNLHCSSQDQIYSTSSKNWWAHNKTKKSNYNFELDQCNIDFEKLFGMSRNFKALSPWITRIEKRRRPQFLLLRLSIILNF